MTGGTITGLTLAAVTDNTIQNPTDYKVTFKVVNNLYFDSRIEI